MKKLTRIFGLSLVLVLVLSLVGGISAQDDLKIIYDGEALGASDLPTLDPSIATDSSSIAVISNTTVQLQIYDEETLELLPGMATVEISEDNTEYTFSIFEGVPWVEYDADAGEVVEVLDEEGNVRFVNANDFAYGITRTLNPETGADYAGVLAPWIVNGAEFLAGDASAEDLGVEVVDEYTLKLSSPTPAGFLGGVYGMWIATAQPSWLIEEVGDTWITDEFYQSYGPFTVKEWNNDESVILINNPFWMGADLGSGMPSAKVDEVHMFVMDQSVSLAEFEAGNLDIGQVPSADIPRIQADPTLSEAFFIAPSKYTYYYGFNVEKAPFDDVRVRQAFSLAIDRQSVIDNVTQGGQAPAGFFTRSDVAAGPSQELTPDLGVPFTGDYAADTATAQALLQEYLDENGITIDELPPITLMHNESEGHARIAQAVQQQWADALGVDVQIATQEWGVYLETLGEDAPQIFRLGWGWDYPDANSFLYDVFHSSSGNNDTNWTSDEFDALVEEGRLLSDQEARRDLYAQADDILVWEDAAIAPIYFYTSLRMFNPEITERTYSVLGYEVYAKWDIN
jgi:oligopeptide transport system substrate-binding protein